MQQLLQANTAVYQEKTLIITFWSFNTIFLVRINPDLAEWKTEIYLVWVLNVDTESKFLQYTTLSFDHLVFRGDVILV